MMSERTEVIVVGAGPAGSMAAAVLAQQGVRVLLLDREEFPRGKACGDVVPLGCFLELRRIGLHRFDHQRFSISRILLEGSQNAKQQFDLTQQQELSTCVISRAVFDQAVFDQAISCGAEYRECNVKGPIFADGQVVGVNGATRGKETQYYGRVIIGADGATSAIARGLGSHPKRDDQWAVALRCYVDAEVDLDGIIELAFLEHIQPGYAWFFPTATRRVNVGVGMRRDFYKRQPLSLNDLLLDYLARPDIAARIGQNRVEQSQSWLIPLFTFERERVFGGALLAGDAGGFVHPITAAGIYPALITGRCAAEATIHALHTGDVSRAGLARYDTLWREALAAEFEPAVTASKLATIFPHLVSAALLLSPANPKSQKPGAFTGGKF